MAQSNNILQELRELGSTLASNPVALPYQLPSGYFDSLAEQVLSRVKAMNAQNAVDETELLSPLVSGISKEMPYALEAGYFEKLNDRILSLVKENSDHQSVEEELQELSPLLSGLKKEMPYSVPTGYFENGVKVPTQQKAKVIPFTSRKWFRYAAAAMIIGIVTTIVLVVNKANRVDPVNNSFVWVEKKMKKVSTDEINNFVALASETLPQKEAVASVNHTNEVKEMIKDIPSSEIQQFLSEIPQDVIVSEEDEIMN